MCKPCQIYFPERDMLDKHINATHPKMNWANLQKQKRKKLLEKLKTDVKSDTKYECSFCPYMASQRGYVLAHEMRMHGELIKRAKKRLRQKQRQQEEQQKLNRQQQEKQQRLKLQQQEQKERQQQEEQQKLKLQQQEKHKLKLQQQEQQKLQLQQLQQQLQEQQPQQPPKKTIRIALKSQSMTVAVVGSSEKPPSKEKTIPEVIVEPEMLIEINDHVEEEATDPIATDTDVFEQAADEEVPDEVIDEGPDEVMEEGSDEVIEEVPDEVIEEVPDDVIEEVPDDVIEEVADEVIEEVLDEVTEEEPEENASESCDATFYDSIYDGTEVVTEVEDERGRRYACPYCKFLTPNRATINTHVTRKHCDEWSSTVKHRLRKNPSLRMSIKDMVHPCFFCEFVASTRTVLGVHTRREHKGFVMPSHSARTNMELHCDQCDFTTHDKRKIQMHIDRKHTTELRFPCEYCGKRFKVKCDLTSHIRFQHFKVPCQCDVCGKICSNSNSLHVHQKREHYKPEFECHICHRRVVSKENLDEHILRQHEQRIDYMCEQCGKIFHQPGKLKQHMMTHTGERPHKCNLCGKAFARRAVFRQHLLIHTGQKPYVCDICGKGFAQKPGLICHRKSHPGDHPPLPVVYIDHILTEFTKKTKEEEEMMEDEQKDEEEKELEAVEQEEVVEEEVNQPTIVMGLDGQFVEIVEEEIVQDFVY